MDQMELGGMSSGCEDENCGLTLSFPEHCPTQDYDCEEPMFGLTELVCVTVIYIPVMILGLLGNVLTILVVWLRPHMRSSTYLYLSSMAVSDLMILLLLPLDLYKLWRPRPWPLGDFACKMTMFLSECCTFCTILHITFLSLERYVAVCWPITAKTLVTRRRTRALIGCLWLGAAISAAPVLVMVGVEEVGEVHPSIDGWRENEGWTGENSGRMTSLDDELDVQKWEERERRFERAGQWNWLDDGPMGAIGEKQHGGAVINKKQVKKSDEEQQNLLKEDEGGGWQTNVDEKHKLEIDRRECRCTDYAISSGLLPAMMILSNLYFLIPVCILGLVYGLIGRTLWLRPQSSRRNQSHKHTVKMLGVIVLAFVLCWLPFHIGRTIFFFSLDTGTDLLYYLSQYFNLGSSVLFYLSAAVNPLLYNVMSARYRHAVQSLIRSQPHAQGLRTLETQRTTIHL
ncbi:growth hormone secretagogue receptor type 1-like [Entelurus aequoreus]|uniref:growth hormone secretagogue receptor type 1-like n=1 Tax=Entelurus aequoreus TaxID=161455 RepID=UPI002B1E2E7E|nr:growth hormone secretagogue receptor type 1-like [Entelurus aequoreus]